MERQCHSVCQNKHMNETFSHSHHCKQEESGGSGAFVIEMGGGGGGEGNKIRPWYVEESNGR